MARRDHEHAQRPLLSVDPRVQEEIRDAYADQFVESSLRAYARRATDERESSEALGQFSGYLAKRALREGYIDTDIIRFGLEHLTDSMDDICREILELQPPRRSALRGLLAKTGLISPPPEHQRTYIRRLDDQYWSKQFLEDYKDSPFFKRRPNESEEEYLGRYINHVIRGFLFAPFSYIR